MKRRRSLRLRPRDVEVLRVRPGDILVYTTVEPLDAETRTHIRDDLQRLAGDDAKAIIVTGGNLSVIRRTAGGTENHAD